MVDNCGSYFSVKDQLAFVWDMGVSDSSEREFWPSCLTKKSHPFNNHFLIQQIEKNCLRTIRILLSFHSIRASPFVAKHVIWTPEKILHCASVCCQL
jgi:hypothetical protein